MGRLEELQEQLRQRDAEHETQRAEQSEADEIAALEAKLAHDPTEIAVIRLQRYAPGLPTLVVAKKPGPAEYKRFRDLILRGEKTRALGFLCGDCRHYPDAKTFADMALVFPELPDQVAMAGSALAKGGAEEEGKS